MESSHIQYYCTHCTHRFSGEDKDVVECPKCFWSSSVKKASEVDLLAKTKHTKKAESKTLKKSGKGIFLFLFLGLTGIGLFFFFTKSESPSDHRKVVSSEIVASDLLKNAKNVAKPLPAEVVQPEISQEELAFLSSKLTYEEIVEKLEIDPSLKKGVSFNLGLVEKLPSQPWGLEQFEDMIEQQEASYKVPLTKSYKKKLKEQFETYYLVGKQSFEAGDYLRSRDEFVKTLAFPIYANDIKRHRGIALTILRPFINDTLSKIGALNTMLVDKNLRSIEAQIQSEYQSLLQLIEAKSWDESMKKIKMIQAMMNDLQSKKLNEMRAPDYPQPLIGLDPSIGASLADILQPSQTLLSDLNPLNQDLVKKYSKIESLSEPFLKKQLEKYNRAASAFDEKAWFDGQNLLNEMKDPSFLAEKAKEKLKKMQELKIV